MPPLARDPAGSRTVVVIIGAESVEGIRGYTRRLARWISSFALVRGVELLSLSMYSDYGYEVRITLDLPPSLADSPLVPRLHRYMPLNDLMSIAP